VRLTGAILGALYSDLRDTALVVRALCHFRSHFLDAVRPCYHIQNPDGRIKISNVASTVPAPVLRSYLLVIRSHLFYLVSAISGSRVAISDSSNSRVSREGITIGCSSYPRHRTWRLPTPLSIFQAWMKEEGLEIRLSGAGKIASQVITALRGLPSIHLLADEDLIRMFGSLAHARFEAVVTDEATSRRTSLLERSLSRRTLMGLLLKLNRNFQLAAENHLKSLTEIGALQLGMRVQCERCSQHNWYALDELREKLRCDRCLKEFDFPISSPPSDAWHYRAAGPFAIEGYAQGGFCVAVSLGRLLDGHWRTSTWIPNFNITKAGKHFYEADFGIFLRDDSAFNRGNNVYLIVGECKSFDRVKARDLSRMRDLAKAFPGATLVFSTFRKELAPVKKRAITNIEIAAGVL
jgi:hypothetical protein